IDLTDEQLDALFDAGCDDATFSIERDGIVLGFFDREAQTQEDAVLSAIDDVERADIGARVLRIAQDDDWLTASEIARRVGRSRQNLGQLVRGDRGPGGFPAPVAREGLTNPLWAWGEARAWFERHEPKIVLERGPAISPGFLAEVNDRLDLRERLRSSPDAPWRTRLAAALPISA
ncbi:MAG: hypothetical protein L0H84_22780, partial [Pseudonocardia sp.]|nr:hypothetical protein [Pseudonocardia sp.]